MRGCREPGDQGVDVVQAPMRGEGVHKGWTKWGGGRLPWEEGVEGRRVDPFVKMRAEKGP